MGGVRLETEASLYWQAASTLRGRYPATRPTAERALATLVRRCRHDPLCRRAADALGVNWPPVPIIRLFDDWPPGGNAA